MSQGDDSIFLIKGKGDLERVVSSSYDSEDILQELIEKYPELLAGDQINPDEPIRFLLIKREAGIPDGERLSDRWSVDHLLLDQNGIPTFVETKRSSDTRIRREIVGQMLDYAANSQKYWSLERIRTMASNQYAGDEATDLEILKLIDQVDDDNSVETIESYWSKVGENIRSGRVRLLFVADKLPSELRRVIEFLNEKMATIDVLGVELVQYIGSDFKALVPKVVGLTEIIRQTKQATKASTQRTTKEEFLSKIPGKLSVFFENLFPEAEKRGMQIYWGVKGFSLRSLASDGKMKSLFYGFPPGANDRDIVYIQGYIGSLEDLEYREKLKKQLLETPHSTMQGAYTINLDLTTDRLDAAEKLMHTVWNAADDISGGVF